VLLDFFVIRRRHIRILSRKSRTTRSPVFAAVHNIVNSVTFSTHVSRQETASHTHTHLAVLDSSACVFFTLLHSGCAAGRRAFQPNIQTLCVVALLPSQIHMWDMQDVLLYSSDVTVNSINALSVSFVGKSLVLLICGSTYFCCKDARFEAVTPCWRTTRRQLSLSCQWSRG